MLSFLNTVISKVFKCRTVRFTQNNKLTDLQLLFCGAEAKMFENH